MSFALFESPACFGHALGARHVMCFLWGLFKTNFARHQLFLCTVGEVNVLCSSVQYVRNEYCFERAVGRALFGVLIC